MSVDNAHKNGAYAYKKQIVNHPAEKPAGELDFFRVLKIEDNADNMRREKNARKKYRNENDKLKT